jgi:hypothetical protein
VQTWCESHLSHLMVTHLFRSRWVCCERCRSKFHGNMWYMQVLAVLNHRPSSHSFLNSDSEWLWEAVVSSALSSRSETRHHCSAHDFVNNWNRRILAVCRAIPRLTVRCPHSYWNCLTIFPGVTHQCTCDVESSSTPLLCRRFRIKIMHDNLPGSYELV